MNILNEFLSASNLGWIQGNFTCNYSFDDLSNKNRQSLEEGTWGEVGGDSGYPVFLKIIFEYKGQIIAILKEKMTRELLVDSEFDVSTKEKQVDLGDLMECRVNLNFIGFYPETYMGTFYACLYECDIETKLDVVINNF